MMMVPTCLRILANPLILFATPTSSLAASGEAAAVLNSSSARAELLETTGKIAASTAMLVRNLRG